MIGIQVLQAGALAASAERTDGESVMDEASFRAFYDASARALNGYLLKITGSETLAQDLLQESYYRLLRSGFEGESEAHRRNYLFRVATNLVRDHYRGPGKRELPLKETPPQPSAGTEIEVRRDLRRAMQDLKPRDRQLLWLGHVEGFSHKEIGAIVGVKAASVRLMLFRARQRLAALLRERGVGPEVLTS